MPRDSEKKTMCQGAVYRITMQPWGEERGLVGPQGRGERGGTGSGHSSSNLQVPKSNSAPVPAAAWVPAHHSQTQVPSRVEGTCKTHFWNNASPATQPGTVGEAKCLALETSRLSRRRSPACLPAPTLYPHLLYSGTFTACYSDSALHCLPPRHTEVTP